MRVNEYSERTGQKGPVFGKVVDWRSVRRVRRGKFCRFGRPDEGSGPGKSDATVATIRSGATRPMRG